MNLDLRLSVKFISQPEFWMIVAIKYFFNSSIMNKVFIKNFNPYITNVKKWIRTRCGNLQGKVFFFFLRSQNTFAQLNKLKNLNAHSLVFTYFTQVNTNLSSLLLIFLNDCEFIKFLIIAYNFHLNNFKFFIIYLIFHAATYFLWTCLYSIILHLKCSKSKMWLIRIFKTFDATQVYEIFWRFNNTQKCTQ